MRITLPSMLRHFFPTQSFQTSGGVKSRAGCAHAGRGGQADGRWLGQPFDVLAEEALIFQHLSCYLQIIFMRDFQSCSIIFFSISFEWHRIAINQSVNEKLKKIFFRNLVGD